MNNMQLLTDFRPETKLWIYAFSRKLDAGETTLVYSVLKNFVDEWKSHQHDVRGAFEIVHNQFILIAAESDNGISGCSIDSSVAVFKWLKAQHNLDIPDNVVDEAIKLSQRYIGDRFLPDKAIDLLDEAAASFRLNCTRAKNGIGDLRKEAEDIKKSLGVKSAADSDDGIEPDVKLKLEAFNEKFDELFSLWTGRV